MSGTAERRRGIEPGPLGARGPWPLVLGLVGLDCLSTLAYLPSLAHDAAGPLAPLAVLPVMAVLLAGVLPVFAFVAGHAHDGLGAVGILVRRLHGWFGKTLVLVLLGFVATDFVITRTIATADAAAHVNANPTLRPLREALAGLDDALAPHLPGAAGEWLRESWTEQLAVAVLLTVLVALFWWFFRHGVTRGILRAAAAGGVVFLLLNLVIVVAGLAGILGGSPAWSAWKEAVAARWQAAGGPGTAPGEAVARSCLAAFPALAIALSGFELSLVVVPLVRGERREGESRRHAGARASRRLLAAAALALAVIVPVTLLVTTVLVPAGELGPGGLAANRALSYLAHGGALAGGAAGLGPLFGPAFGTVYDVAAVVVLALAGASVTLGFARLVPPVLARFGMELAWVRSTGALMHLLNLIGLLVIVVFGASVTAQRGAFSTAVLVLLAGAAAAAAVEAGRGTRSLPVRWAGAAGASVVALGLTVAAAGSVRTSPDGLVLALGFVAAVVVTSMVSRFLRATELRFAGFAFDGEPSRALWGELKPLAFPVLVPHRPGRRSLADKEKEIRVTHRLGPDVPVVFVEAVLGDTSEFFQLPEIAACREEGRIVLRIKRCASIAHTIAAVALELSRESAPPEIHFGWSDENPLAANLGFVLYGEGNVPWLVRELIRRAEPDPARRPRIVIG